MTAQEILTSLSQLESELESISSARVLTEQTVNAYKDVQKDIKSFFSEFKHVNNVLNVLAKAFESEKNAFTKEVASSIETLKGQLIEVKNSFDNQCSKIILNFSESIDNSNQNFSNRCDSRISEFKQNNEDLKRQLSDLSSIRGAFREVLTTFGNLRSDLETLQSKLLESQKEQDKVLNDIAADLKSTSKNLVAMLTSLSVKLTDFKDSQDRNLADLKERQKQVVLTLCTVTQKEEAIIAGIEKIITQSNERIASLMQLLEESKQNLGVLCGKVDYIKTQLDSTISKIDSMNTKHDIVAQGVITNRNLINSVGSNIECKINDSVGKINANNKIGKSIKTLVILNLLLTLLLLGFMILKIKFLR